MIGIKSMIREILQHDHEIRSEEQCEGQMKCENDENSEYANEDREGQSRGHAPKIDAYHLLKLIQWPTRESCFDHDEFFQKIENSVARHMAKGIPDEILAENLHNALGNQNGIGQLYSSEIGEPKVLTTHKVMSALKKCDKEFLEVSNHEKWKRMKKGAEESMDSFCKRVIKKHDEWIGEPGKEELRARVIKEQIIEKADIPDDIATLLLMTDKLEAIPRYIRYAMERKQMHEANRLDHVAPNSPWTCSSANEATQGPEWQPSMQYSTQARPKKFCKNCRQTGHTRSECKNEPHCNICGSTAHANGGHVHMPRPPGMQYSTKARPEKFCKNCRQMDHTYGECEYGSFCSLCYCTGHTNRDHMRGQI